MSGHSKWSQIKRQKEVTDKKRGNLFTKLGHTIAIAARPGDDPQSNPQLRLAIEQAKKAGMPKDNIERAIKRGAGKLEGSQLEEITYEAFGPGGIALIIQVVTDNRNRTISDVRSILTKHGGRLGDSNSVQWMFTRKGVIRIDQAELSDQEKEELELKVIDAGVEDFAEEEEGLVIYTKPEYLFKVKENLENQGRQVDFAEIEFMPKEKVHLADEKTKEKINKLIETLEEADDVNNFFTNAEI